MPAADRGMTVAIVGAGFSGTMTAVQLARSASARPADEAAGAPLRIVLVERNDAWGRGIAYAATEAPVRLNVPAIGMSAFPDDREHFLRWLCLREPAAGPGTFARRSTYGEYLEQLLRSEEASGDPSVIVERTAAEVVAAIPDGAGVRLDLAGGGRIEADRAVLAIGNFPPSDPQVADPTFYRDPRYYGTPWSATALEGLERHVPVLLVGTGLTMFDLVAALAERGHEAPIHVLSRHGLLPQAHRVAAASPYPWSFDPAAIEPRIRPLMHALRKAARSVQAAGGDWHSVLDGLRPHVQAIWRSLPADERRRFLRHARPYWEIHRHRLAPEVLDVFEEARHAGRVTVHAGRLDAFVPDADGVDVRIALRGGAGMRTLRVGRVINCTGPTSAYRQLQHPLVLDLFGRGLARPDPLHLGLDTAPDGALLDAHGQPSDALFTIGPPRKGALWETTAVPELREQAAALAARLLRTDGSPSSPVAPSRKDA